MTARREKTGRGSIRGHLRVGVAAVALLVGGVGGWAATTEISGAVIAPGMLVVDSNVKDVQHPTGGIVAEIGAIDGDRVRAGDVLVRLDATVTRANLAIITRGLTELVARKARLEAERDEAESLSIPDSLFSRSDDPEVAAVILGEVRLFDLRKAARAGQKEMLRERISQFGEEIGGLEAQLSAKDREIVFILRELEGSRDLYKKGLLPITKLTQLEREATRVEGRLLHVPARVLRVLAHVGALLVHRPDVHGAVAIGDEIHAAVPPQGRMTLSRIVRGHGHGLGLAFGELPDLARGPALVAPRHVLVERGTHEIESAAALVVGPFGSLGEGNPGALTRLEADGHELWIGQGGVALSGVDEVARGRPGRGDRRLGLEGSARGHPAFHRHRVDLNRSLVPRGEGEGASVGGKQRVRLLGGMGGDPSRQAALGGDRPQIALGGKNYGLAAQRGESIEALGPRGRAGLGRDRAWGQANEQGQRKCAENSALHADISFEICCSRRFGNVGI